MICIIEHLEKRVWKWCLIEYEHIASIVGKRNMWVTNVRRKYRKLEAIAGRVFRESASELNIERGNVCVLDPQAKKELKPGEASKFKYFIFGGILGDYPPRKRTRKELSSKFGKGANLRNIGKKQLPTDNAVYAVREICNGKRMKDMEFSDGAVIKINDVEERELPFYYVKVDGKPLMSHRLESFLRRKRGL